MWCLDAGPRVGNEPALSTTLCWITAKCAIAMLCWCRMEDHKYLRPIEREILAILRRQRQVRRSRLSELSGLPQSTIADAVRRLKQRGLVLELSEPSAPDRPRVGRPARLLALAPPRGPVGVVLLTHGTLQAAVALADGTLRSRRAIDAQVRSLTTGFVEPSLALLDEALSDVSLTRADLACAVIGLPMPLVRGRGLAIPGPAPWAMERVNPSLAPLPDWVRTVPSIELSDRLGVPVLAENDANLGALGEGHFGAAAEMTSFIYIKLVQGIGAGIVIDGRLHRGAGGLAGELSHLHVDDDGPMCGCGGRGCLIMGLHTPHLVDLILPLHPEALDMADLLTLVGEGDVGVCRVLRDLGKVIGRSLADFCVYVDPEGIIVDGLLEGAADPVIDGIRQMLHQCAPPVLASRVRIACGRLGSQAELLGATVLARQYLQGEDARSDDLAALASAP